MLASSAYGPYELKRFDDPHFILCIRMTTFLANFERKMSREDSEPP